MTVASSNQNKHHHRLKLKKILECLIVLFNFLNKNVPEIFE